MKNGTCELAIVTAFIGELNQMEANWVIQDVAGERICEAFKPGGALCQGHDAVAFLLSRRVDKSTLAAHGSTSRRAP
jgi:hypothetical protein